MWTDIPVQTPTCGTFDKYQRNDYYASVCRIIQSGYSMTRDRTSIKLSKEVRDRLKAEGKKGESYDELVDRLIDQSTTGEVKQ